MKDVIIQFILELDMKGLISDSFDWEKETENFLKSNDVAVNYTRCCTEFICHSCNEKKSGQNDDQLHEVCKECFSGI